jgi:large subunit ribosomal protein L25
MSNNFSLYAQARDLQGKGASRRLRHTNLVPAVIYGGSAAAQSIAVQFKDIVKCLENEAFYSHILTLNVDGNAEQVVLKALQRHPSKGFPMHADFYRVEAGHAITMRVPLHFTNQETSVGVKQQGGAVSIIATDIEISTLPSNLPEFIEVDLSAVEVGTTIHLSDIKLPEGVTIPALAHGADHDQAVANIHAAGKAE